jgi:hypothetical protein
LAHIADTRELSLGFSRHDPTSWAPYDTWGRLCGAVTAQFDATKCSLCASTAFPSIHQDCSHEERRLSGLVWAMFDSHKEETRRRRLQEGFDAPKDPNVRGNRGLLDESEMCPYIAFPPAYPVKEDTSYFALVGPLLTEVALDIDVDLSAVGVGSNSVDDPPGSVEVQAILANFESRTNQVSCDDVATHEA